MPTIADIARHWGVSRPRVSKLVNKEGCPTNSLKAADRWRESRGQKRAATNKGDERMEKVAAGRPRAIKRPSKTGDSLLDALNNAIAVADGAFEEYELARVGKLPTRSARLSEHNKALDARLKAEKAYREELERRGVLVMKTEITEKCRRGLDSVLRRLNKLPQECGPQCNPSEPLMAVTVLQRAVDEIKGSAQMAMSEL